MRFKSRRRTGAGSLAVLALLVALFGAAPAAASEAPPEEVDELSAAMSLQQERITVPDDAHPEADGTSGKGARTMWTWSAGRRGYFLGGYHARHGFTKIWSVDLDSRETVAEAELRPGGLGDVNNMIGQPHLAVVDETAGRLAVAYHTPHLLQTDTGSVGDTLQGLTRESDRLVPEGTWPEGLCDPIPDSPPAAKTVKDLCVQRVAPEPLLFSQVKGVDPEVIAPALPTLQACASAHVHCFAGLNVLNGRTLEPEKVIEYRPVQVDGGAVVPFLRAMRFDDAQTVGDETIPAKVYAVVEEATGFVGFPQQPRTDASNVIYAVQFDLETGRQDWALRIDQCRGTRENRDSGSTLNQLREIPHAATVYRTASGGQPVLVVGCHSGSTQVGTVVRVPLTLTSVPQGAVDAPTQASVPDVSAEAGAPSPQQLVPQASSAQSYAGPDKVWSMLADPVSDRVLMKVVDGNPPSEVWWVFDSGLGKFIGTIGIGPYTPFTTRSVLDPVTGRLYVRGGETGSFSGGLFAVDIRRTPLPQALVFPKLTLPSGAGQMTLDLSDGERPTRVFSKVDQEIQIIVDTLPVSVDLPVDDFVGRTLDLEEVDGVTVASFDGVARGYGLRALFVGGLEAATRVGPVDPMGQAFGVQGAALGFSPFQPGGAGHSLVRNGTLPVTSPCTEVNREVVLGMVGPDSPAVVDGSGGRAAAEPVIVDTGLRADSEAPASRCAPIEWDNVWRTALFNNPPVEEPTTKWMFGNGEASCVSSSENKEGAFGDSVTGGFAAKVSCDEEGVSGWSYARGGSLEGGVNVAEASSRFTVYRDPGRGVVSRVESVVRGVDVPGAFRIDLVRSVAESWANGRRQPVDAADRAEDYDPACDFERTAGTCFRRQIMGVQSPHFVCSQCGDQRAVVEGLNRAFGSQGTILLREPDARMAAGSENGFIAAVTKPDTERFGDLVLNNDLLQTVVPGLEIVRYAAPNRSVGGGGQRGRQIYQFAGVEVSSSYGIQCLLVYDKETNTCAAAKEAPGSLTVSLVDGDGKPLAGGAFEVRNDTDADGVLGLADTLLPEGACVTAQDGVGTCRFEALQPGTYLVTQVAAPPGFAKYEESSVVELASGDARTLEVTNLSNIAVISVKAADESGAPVAGAVFGAYPDPDADGKVAADAKAAGECTTGADGTCEIRVPAGSYVLVQTAAPGGLEGIEPVAFTVAGGQTAAVGVVNYPPEGPAAPEPAAGPAVSYEPPPALPEPVLTTDTYEPSGPVVDDVEEPAVSLPEAVGGTVVQVIRAPGDALRLLARDPMQAVAWIASLALFTLAVLAVRRRMQASTLLQR